MGHAIVWIMTMVSTTAAYASWGFVPALVVFAVLATVLTSLRVSWEDRAVETTATRGGFFKEAFLSGFEEGRENMRERQERKLLEREEKKAEKKRKKEQGS